MRWKGGGRFNGPPVLRNAEIADLPGYQKEPEAPKPEHAWGWLDRGDEPKSNLWLAATASC